MFEAALKFINRHTSLAIIIAVILAIFLPGLANIAKPAVPHLLALILFLGFLKTNFSIMGSEIQRWKYHLYLFILTALLLPIIIFFITTTIVHFTNLPTGFLIAILLIYSAPTAATTPILCILLKGRLELAMLNVIITFLLTPISVPLLFHLLMSKNIQLPTAELFSFTGLIIILPFISALILRAVAPKFREKINQATEPLTIILLFLLMFGASSILHSLFFSHLLLALKGLLLATGIFCFAFTAGWFLSFKKHYEEKITVAMMSAWTNIGLAIVIASRFFQTSHPHAIFLVIISTVVWNVAIALARPTQKIISHYHHRKSKQR